MDRFQSAHQKRISRRQEKEIASDVGGRTQAASGATRFGGGDVSSDTYLVECKVTEKDTYTVKLSDLHKLRKHAMTKHKTPLFVFRFLHSIGHAEYVVIEDDGRQVWAQINGSKSIKISRLAMGGPLARATRMQFDRSRTYPHYPVFYLVMAWDAYREEP